MRVPPAMIVAVGLVAFATAWTLVHVIRDLAHRQGVLDVPNERSSHVRPTPRLGGLGLLVGIVVPVTVIAALNGVLTDGLIVVLGLATIVSLVSLLDDLRGLSPMTRLIVHVTAAAFAVWRLGSLAPGSPGLGDGATAGVLATVATVLWIAGFINAFNFMDGTDGIGGTQAVVAAAAWGVVGWWLDEPALAVLGTGVAAASAGFLLHNWSPASIFMGDVGSALLGCLLAMLPLLGERRRSLWPGVILVWPFVFDTTVTLLRRARRGEALMSPHRTHLYQRLTQAGWPHARTAALYGALALAGALVAVPMATGAAMSPVWGLTLLAAGTTLLWMLTGRVERRRRAAASDGRNRHA